MKSNTTISIESEVLLSAREKNLNISHICEDAIKLYVESTQEGAVETEGMAKFRRLEWERQKRQFEQQLASLWVKKQVNPKRYDFPFSCALTKYAHEYGVERAEALQIAEGKRNTPRTPKEKEGN